ncbi:MAG: hypothetical protein A2Y38_09215 [Spirochaetes bacterium GWB1_59_5]|nr:MAG: hypothetical protein A2Y38_09215 [Spirochaetes bacterium GWB1_59_5]
MSGAAPQPTEALRFLKNKKIVPVENWDLIGGAEHAHAFTASHITNTEALESIHGLMVQAMEEGIPYDRFKKDFLSMMDARGWALHPDKNNDAEYRNWRVDIIHRTNMRTARSAASYRQQLRESKLRPYWVYKQKQRPTKRAEHEPLNDVAKRFDDAFWDTYYPPNGWGCDCYVQSLSANQVEGGNYKREVPPDFNPSSVPAEWRHNPGLETLAPDFSKFDNLRRYSVNGKSAVSLIKEAYQSEISELQLSSGEWKKLSDRIMKQVADPATGKLSFSYQVQNIQHFAGAIDSVVAEAIKTDEIKMMYSDRALQHGRRAHKADTAIGQVLPADQVVSLPAWFANPDRVYRETSGEYHFVKRYNGPSPRSLQPGEELCVRGVFRKRGVATAWQLVTYMIVPLENESGFTLLYQK